MRGRYSLAAFLPTLAYLTLAEGFIDDFRCGSKRQWREGARDDYMRHQIQCRFDKDSVLLLRRFVFRLNI
jgi:hypothetical protein